eukprot:6111189-Amphidinium_carterae.3
METTMMDIQCARREGRNEQGTYTIDQQELVQGGRQQDIHTTTTTTSGSYEVGDHTTTNQ